MLYINENGITTKYQVEIDYKKLREVRREIIQNCSIIETRRKEGVLDCVESETIQNIRNVSKMQKEDREYTSWTYYDFDYDFYQFPPIIASIDAILNGKEDAIAELESVKDLVPKKPINVIESFRNIEKECQNNTPIEQVRYMQWSLAKLEQLLTEESTRRGPEKSVQEYVPRLYQCFQFDPVLSMPTEQLNAAMEFLQQSDCDISLNKKTPVLHNAERTIAFVKQRVMKGDEKNV